MTLVAGRAGSHAQQPPVPAPQAPGQAPGGGRGGPRNIQVLKDVPQDQILLTMQYISASLGVQCNYCHVQGQNDLDDKEPKKIAREMMKMVDRVNATFFDAKPRVSCASCHNGRATPVRTPPLAVEMTAEQAAAFARGRGGRGGPGGGPGGPGRGAEPPPPPVPTETVDRDPREIRSGARWASGRAERKEPRDDRDADLARAGHLEHHGAGAGDRRVSHRHRDAADRDDSSGTRTRMSPSS